MSSTINSDTQQMYHEILYPEPKKSYNSRFFGCGYHLTDIKETYSKSDKRIVKIFKIFAKLFAMLLVNSLKLVIAVTIITPLVFTFVSIYQKRKITTGNKDLNRKAIALVKASEAHMSLGNVQHAVEEQSVQSEVMDGYDTTHCYALKNTIQYCQDRAILHHNLIVTAKAWGDVVKKRLADSPEKEGQGHFAKTEFIEYAVKTLSDQGLPKNLNINSVNATLALTEDLTVSTGRSMFFIKFDYKSIDVKEAYN